MNAADTRKLYEERLGRYQAAIALEPTDRMPIATGSNYFAEVYSGNTKQMTIYDPLSSTTSDFSAPLHPVHPFA